MASHSTPIATAAASGTPCGPSSSFIPPSRTPMPLMLIGRTMASAKSGTTVNHSESGWSTPTARPSIDTAVAPPIWTSRLHATALTIRLGRSW